MIAKVSKGRGFRGLIHYLEGKEGAERLAGSVVGATPEIAQEFGAVRRLRPNVERAVFHLSLRPPPGEILSNAQWIAAADRLVVGMGFEDSPWVAYLHRDSREDHLHLVASRVTYDGRVVSDSNDYRRAHELAREIERELGLTIVAPAPSDKRSLTQGEFKRQERTGEVSVRSALQERIERAAEGRPTFAVFLDRLHAQGVEASPAITSRGRIVGISYRFEGHAFSGSALGRSFTWGGLQQRLGVRLDAERDLPALFAAARSVQRGTSFPSPPSTFTSSLPAQEAAMAQTTPTTHVAQENTPSDVAVRRQLLALGGERFDVLVVDASQGTTTSRRGWSLDQVLKSVPWLRHENAQGREILVRPERPSPSVAVFDLSARELDLARRRGLDPAAVVGLRDGRSEAWFRFAEPLNREQAQAATAVLERQLEIGAREVSEYGHLAGFRSYLGVEREQASWVQLERASGVVFERAVEIHAEIAPRSVIRTIEAPAIDLAEIAREEFQATPRTVFDSPEPDSVLDRSLLRRLSSDYERAVEAHFELQRAASEALPERSAQPSFDLVDPLPSRDDFWVERKSVESYRAFRVIEREVEDRIGIWPLPDADTFEQSVERAIEFVAASGDEKSPSLESFADSVLDRGRVDFEDVLALGQRALDRAEALSALGVWERSAGLALEENRFDLERALAAASFEAERISFGVERLETRVADGPVAGSDRLQGLLVLELDSLSRLDPVLDELRGRVAEAQLLSIDRDLDRWVAELRSVPSAEGFREVARLLEERNGAVERVAGRAPLEGIETVSETPSVRAAERAFAEAAREFATLPSAARFEALREASGQLHEARRSEVELGVEREFGAAQRELSGVERELRTVGSLGPAQAAEVETRYRAALDRYFAAEDGVADRVGSRVETAGAGDRLRGLTERAHQGDLSPESLARLHRGLAAETARSTGVWPRSPGVEPRLEGDVSLARSAADWRASQGRLRDELRGFLGREGRPSPVDVERLRGAVEAYQVATRRLSLSLDRGVEGAIDPAARVLAGVRGLGSSGRVREAAGVWARQAAALGQSVATIARQLSRSVPRSLFASLSPLGRGAARSISASAVGVVKRYLVKKVHEMVNER